MMMKVLALTTAFFVLCLLNGARTEEDLDFPSLEELGISFFQTEVQITDVEQQATSYATEYHDNIDRRGKVEILSVGERMQVFYINDSDASEVFSVNSTTCEVWDADISDYTDEAIFYGWLNLDPLIIGPSAALFYAQKHRDELVNEGVEVVRDIPCDKHSLVIKDKKLKTDIKLYYYFAPKHWTTPYQVVYEGKKLRVPIRIHAFGLPYTQDANETRGLINQINDFAYFKPLIDDMTELEPPVGIGCRLRAKTDDLPDIPDSFTFSAEVVDLFKADNEATTDIEFHKVWFDYDGRLARLDIYSKKRMISELHDFKTGALYSILDDRSCNVKPLRNSDFEAYDIGAVARMKEAKEVLYLDGDFYEMGQREFRGMICDTYESVVPNVTFMGKYLDRLVVTAYFLESDTLAGVEGRMESRIPVYLLLTGWDTPTSVAVKMQYNIFGFDDVIQPRMYRSFRLQRCFPNPESKTYFFLMLDVPASVAAQMENQGDLIIEELRGGISKYAKVSEMRIPFLKADYKPSGVFVTGLLLERPPALMQFYFFDSGPTTTKDPDLKVSLTAATLEDCAYACIDEAEFTCKGFFFCNKACFLKSIDPLESVGTGSERDLGECDDYIRTEAESSNFRDTYLGAALDNLQDAVLKKNLTVIFNISGGIGKVAVADIVIGVGPDADVNTGEKPYEQVVSYRKLNIDDQTTQTIDSTETLADCYKGCKEAGDLCSSFSFCPLSRKTNKECLITSKLIVDEKTNSADMTSDRDCFIYRLKYTDYFIPYEGKVVLLSGDDVINKVASADACAKNCQMAKKFKCRGFEYCPSSKTCTLHSKHILDLKPGEVVNSGWGRTCTHYAARYIVDYDDMGVVLIEDNSDFREEMTLEECAKVCSEELKDSCKSFNYCPATMPMASDSSCSLSSKILRDTKITTTEKERCRHFEKKAGITDWKNKASVENLSASGYTKKGFAGLVIGMLALGLIIGALGFVAYSYFKSRSSNEGMTVRFMKQET